MEGLQQDFVRVGHGHGHQGRSEPTGAREGLPPNIAVKGTKLDEILMHGTMRDLLLDSLPPGGGGGSVDRPRGITCTLAILLRHRQMHPRRRKAQQFLRREELGWENRSCKGEGN